MSETQPENSEQLPFQLSRRQFWVGGGLATAGLFSLAYVRDLMREPAPVFVARHQTYEGDLSQTIQDGLLAVGLDPQRLKGKRVLLKPNMVEPFRESPQMTTDPAMVVATAEVFRRWGADVTVGEGPGHVRDTDAALEIARIGPAIKEAGIPFADLNYEETTFVKNKGRASNLDGFHFPNSVVNADLIVSMPKMKTHHWVGVTAAMKNMYGVIPGIRYGWPKNVLHFNGIPQTVFDINASLPKTIAIVDGILCMEGDGPIMGTPKPMGVIVIGATPAAVDATVCRIMDVRPELIPYLSLARNKLGPIDERLIEQRGEDWQPLSTPFEIIDTPHLQEIIEHRAVKSS